MWQFLILCLLVVSVPAYAQYMLAHTNPYVAGSVAAATTNYCNDANAVGCWYMNVDTSGSEVDRTSNGNDLAVSAGDEIPRVNGAGNVPTGYGGYSRDFESLDTDYLEESADGSELDINGADATISIVAWIKVEYIGATQERYICGKFNSGGGATAVSARNLQPLVGQSV